MQYNIEYFTEMLFGGNPIYDVDAGLVNKVIEKPGGSEELFGLLASAPVKKLNEAFEEIASDRIGGKLSREPSP